MLLIRFLISFLENIAIFKTLVLGCLKELEAGTGTVGKLRVSSFSLLRLFQAKTKFERTKPRGFVTSWYFEISDQIFTSTNLSHTKDMLIRPGIPGSMYATVSPPGLASSLEPHESRNVGAGCWICCHAGFQYFWSVIFRPPHRDDRNRAYGLFSHLASLKNTLNLWDLLTDRESVFK